MTGHRSESGASALAEPDLPGSALFSCVDVARTYGGGAHAVVAVHAVTCTILPSTRIALTGPSGSGKSTLLHLMAGLEVPTAGDVEWPALGGHPIGHPGRVGVVFQGPSLLPALNVTENVALPLLLADTGEAEATLRSADALRRLGIGDLGNKLPEELSGGQSQRVAIARVLAARPRLILADEPTGQLDHESAATVLDVLVQASDELGAALVVSTHDPLIAQRLRGTWVMRDGRLVSGSSGGGA
ncbi:MAG: ATP-binding cassette domain-containing protein [Actinomycetota bacterium]|nr:ATP-binding cassette domain-containing protein [Actinomycetota bacterium]